MLPIQQGAQNLEDVRELNLSRVIKLLQARKYTSRADIAKSTGLRQSTVTNIVNELIANDLVAETGLIEGKRGRRSIGIALQQERFQVIGIRLDRDFFMIGVFDITGERKESQNYHLSPNQPIDAVLADMLQMIDNYLQNNSGVLGIGISSPGPFIRKNESIALLTSGDQWEGVNIRRLIQDNFTLPTYIEHDAKAGALAHSWFSVDGHKADTMVYIAAGLGVGSGVLNKGQLLEGELGTACEIGHMSIDYNGIACPCGSHGCLERYCSIQAVLSTAREELALGRDSLLASDCSYEDILHAWRQGDSLATEVLVNAAYYLGIGVANVINIYNPGEVILGDLLADMGEPMLDTVVVTAKERVIPAIWEETSIRLSEFDCDPAFMGAAAVAFDGILEKPSLLLAGESVKA